MKTIIITGAASGLGKSISEEFDKKKCNLVLCDRNLIDIKKYKNQVLFFKIDLTDEKQIKKLFDETLKKFKKIDIVINNAGITDKKHFSEFSSKEIDNIMDVNFKAVTISTNLAYKHMKKGVIATISSLGGIVSLKNYSAYSASKHAVEGYLKSVRKEMDKKIKIIIFRPFRLDTNLNKKSKIKSPSKHRLDPKIYAEYVVATINRQILKSSYYFLRNWVIWIGKIIF
ncbi:SDR family oxidoreductase [archaeon]|jgi:dehydrogenase/reductase SDR family member 7B|nr:SDR family oxidoreductase [archaeon]MBT4022349.1 SDR family oxidoreductase [archaeon]MBT4273227.1 SDR family oxidoreductase [archaeon]MBT4461330.1 SDR family oxidoreductase [archaeon]MBT4858991.1 SDR family oxidoreductase [archaeon]